MKAQLLLASLASLSAVSAHSWVECANHDNAEILQWMKGNSTLNPPVIIDPAMPWFAYLCKGWPRNKKNPGNWIDESSNYIWNIAANSWDGGSYHPPDTNACHPSQRTPTYQANAPMTTVSPGGMFRLRYGGNGHARGSNVPGGDPGTVSVYWKGKPEAEITDIKEFTKANELVTAGFAANSFSYPANPAIKSPTQGLVDKGNWLEVNLPKDIAPGRHMMVWVWNSQGAPQWSTCFDVWVQGGAAPAAPAAPAQATPTAPVKAAVGAPSPYSEPPAAPAAAAPEVPAAAPAAPEVPAAPPANPEPSPAAAAPADSSPAPAAPAAPAETTKSGRKAWWNDRLKHHHWNKDGPNKRRSRKFVA